MFWTLFSQSMILSGFITVMCMGTLCYLAATGQAIPQILVDICLIVVSFFFGTKAMSTGMGRAKGPDTHTTRVE